jgi:TRAP transporter TAXI family solute receptor
MKTDGRRPARGRAAKHARWCALVCPAVLAVVTAGCVSKAAAPPTTKLTLLTAPGPGAFHEVGTALAHAYNRYIPDIEVQAQHRPVPIPNVDALERGTAELALTVTGEAYVAYTTGASFSTAPQGNGHTRLRAIASLFTTKFHIVTRRDSAIRTLADLHGRAVAVATPGSPGEKFKSVVLEAYGLKNDDEDVWMVSESGADIAMRMRDGRLDAVVGFSGLRPALLNETAESVDVRLIPIERDRAAAIQNELPFLMSTVIPAGTYREQTEDVPTLGQDVILICRDDLPEDLVYRLTRTIFEAADELAASHPVARAISAERGPAVSIPLHPGALRYYRARELLR